MAECVMPASYATAHPCISPDKSTAWSGEAAVEIIWAPASSSLRLGASVRQLILTTSRLQ